MHFGRRGEIVRINGRTLLILTGIKLQPRTERAARLLTSKNMVAPVSKVGAIRVLKKMNSGAAWRTATPYKSA